MRDAISLLADEFGLSEEQRREVLPSGSQRRFDNRVGWARTYMTKAGLLASPRRGWFQITERGRQVLSERPDRIDLKLLERFDEYLEFKRLRHEKPAPAEGDGGDDTAADSDDGQTPQEQLESAYQGLREELADEILTTVKASSPDFFERLVVDLLVKMGYGGSRREAGQAVGRAGDEGIDGIIKEDRLGLDIIYIQAKRWTENAIGRPEIQKFAGALQGQQANKGIFITSSTFTREARDFVDRIGSKIILIDGIQLADLMIDHGVGVATESVYEVKRLDTDYFLDD